MNVRVLNSSDAADPYATKDTVLLNGLATVHIMFGMHATALKFLELSIWIDGSNIETLRLLAKAHFNLRHSAKVIQILERVQKLLGKDGLSEEEILLKGRSLALLGQTEKARDVLYAVYETN